MFTLPESERLKGKTAISALMREGRWGGASSLKYCYLSSAEDGAPNRIMVSVPKKLFKRAVKRNLLKRRIRESYRTSKHLLPRMGTSVMFLYNSKEILDIHGINEDVAFILKKIADETKR